MDKLYTDTLEKAKEDYLNRCFEICGKRKLLFCVADERDFYVNQKKR